MRRAPFACITDTGWYDFYSALTTHSAKGMFRRVLVRLLIAVLDVVVVVAEVKYQQW